MIKTACYTMIIASFLAGCSSPKPTQIQSVMNPTSTVLFSPTSEIQNHENGWDISTQVEIIGKTVTVNGDLIISEAGSLHLTSATLIMKSPDSNPPKIEVKSGGSVMFDNSIITASTPVVGYQFIIDKGSIGKIEGSVVEYVAPNDLFFGKDPIREHAGGGGLTISADGFIVRNSVLRNFVNQARAILVGEASGVVIEGNMIYDNPNDGIRLAACENAEIRNNLISGNGTYGVKFMGCKNSQVTGNIVRNNAFSREMPLIGAGVYIDFASEGIVVSGNTIAGNGRDAVVIGNSQGILLSSNVIAGNGGYGVNIYGGSDENTVSGNVLRDNRHEGIFVEEGCAGNVVSGNVVEFPVFAGSVDDFENPAPDDYWILSYGDAQASYSILPGGGMDGSAALKLEYAYSQPNSFTTIFGKIGQNWSGYRHFQFWAKSDQTVILEMEVNEDDGDVWFYNWNTQPLKAGDWSRIRVPLYMLIKRTDRSTGDGILNLQGVGRYRLSVSPAVPSETGNHVILFDNVQLTK